MCINVVQHAVIYAESPFTLSLHLQKDDYLELVLPINELVVPINIGVPQAQLQADFSLVTGLVNHCEQ